MIILENLFGEFIDCALGISPVEAVELGASYKLYGGHTIGVWLFIGVVVTGLIACCVSKKFRKYFGF